MVMMIVTGGATHKHWHNFDIMERIDKHVRSSQTAGALVLVGVAH